jgi:hypothetical protein
MTMTLYGRWQTRLLLLWTAGLLLTLLFGLAYGDTGTPLALLLYVTLLGLGWDMLYHYLQGFRWEGDWPPLFQLIGGLAEGLLLWALVRTLPGGLPGVNLALTAGQFAAHYLTVLLVTLALMLGPVKLLFPRWRYHGGQWF